MTKDPAADRPIHPRCGVCGGLLGGDPDDQPLHPAGPQCGDSVRAREFDETLWELDLSTQGDDW